MKKHSKSQYKHVQQENLCLLTPSPALFVSSYSDFRFSSSKIKVGRQSLLSPVLKQRSPSDAFSTVAPPNLP